MNTLQLNKETMTVYEIAKLVEYAPKHAKAMEVCETLMKDADFTGADSAPALQSVTYNAQGQTTQSYALNKRQSFALASRLNVSFLMRIVDRWQELENNKPQLPQTLPDALRAYADEVEEHDKTKEALELEQTQHDATRTQLEYTSTQLDQSKEYFSIKRVAANNGVSWKVYSWRKLKATGAPIVKIFDANYGEVNAYHHTAWKLAYPDAIIPR